MQRSECLAADAGGVPVGEAGSEIDECGRDIATSQALLQLIGARRSFQTGADSVIALRDVSLSINAGEFVAIVGASGSGKSTLMNVLGCMDRPTQGSYLIDGQQTQTMTADELAELRNRHFGFVFQRYLLLPGLSALQNVEMPAIYGAEPAASRRTRAVALLHAVGLADRQTHLPNQLSGGEQQRVALARALMNGGRVILADEPTGALDPSSAQDVMRLLHQLHQRGHTVIIVTHDMGVASHAERIIEFSDGRIMADRRNEKVAAARAFTDLPAQVERPLLRGWGYWAEMLRLAWQELLVHRLRTHLTVMGIAIGVSVVLCVQALLDGGQQEVERQLSAMGSRCIQIMQGDGPGDRRARAVDTLVPEDARALKGQPFVDRVTPVLSRSATLRAGSVVVDATLTGVGEDYFRIFPLKLLQGNTFSAEQIERSAPEVLIEEAARRKLLPHEPNPIGKTILIGRLPVRVVGVVAPLNPGDPGDALNIYLPYTTVLNRVAKSSLMMIAVTVPASVSTDLAEQAIERLLVERHRVKDFFTQNIDRMRQAEERSQRIFNILALSIGLASLIVAGIGVTNIMLMSVTQRAREIGIRMAVGARPADIGLQFIIEATLMCLLGAAAGVILARAIGVAFMSFVEEMPMLFSRSMTLMAFVLPLALGVAFGLMPARRAARLDPVEAIARE